MRHAAVPGVMVVLLVVTTLSCCGAEVPHDWRREWPRTDFCRHAVAFSEILSGGPEKDGIPPIDAPRFEPVRALTAPSAPREPVISVEIAGDARAYPLGVPIWHEIVNDTVGGVPVAVTDSPLCNSGVVFERIVGGAVTTFGTTGKLRNADLVMYDRATEIWRQQFEGRAILGTHAGERLAARPARLEPLADSSARHPDERVRVPADAGLRDYGRNPYAGYDGAAIPFLFSGAYEGPGSPLMRVLAVPGRPEAWSLPYLRKATPIRTGDLVITWTPGQVSALDAPRVAVGRDVGIVHVERRLPGGGRAPVVYDVPFAFAFAAFNPEATMWHGD